MYMQQSLSADNYPLTICTHLYHYLALQDDLNLLLSFYLRIGQQEEHLATVLVQLTHYFLVLHLQA